MRLYNTYSRQLEKLPPPPGPVRMYFCGPTVYQRIHVGNARPFVISMWLRRWLERSGYEVTLVENITDVNDKIYDAAPGASAELAGRASGWYVEDTSDLGLGRPDHEPKATETIPEIVALIQELVEGGLAYPVDGDVYFRVARFPDYGRLSGRHGDEDAVRNPSEEAEPSELKEDPRDFALWKGHKEGEDTWWESPWGRGRPGWHIECSAMAERHLGPEFEIHGGGLDLRFPHHENELAQSRGAGRPFARIWAHNGLLELDEEKMSKSVGNIVSLREVLDTYGREAILFFFLGAHYRSPIAYSDDAMEQARAQVAEFRTAFRVAATRGASDWSAFEAALDDDFSTPLALAILHAWRSAGELEPLERGLAIFGLSVEDAGDAPPEVVRLAEEREEARAARDFERSDGLRDQILELGWELRDTPDGQELVPRG